jgi:nucleoside-diphosphate-sugar epimerase
MSEHPIHRILITGAAGKIGTALRAGLRGLFPLIY